LKKVLIVGGGGREHALAWKLSQSSQVQEIHVAPGNAGTAQVGRNVPINILAVKELLDYATSAGIDLTIVGPDDALAVGLVDVFLEEGLRVFGPTRLAAEIESSKVFAKQLMSAVGVPTAAYRVFGEYEQALAYVRAYDGPLVIKAAGLARGKGVYPCRSQEAAEEALNALMVGRVHGEAGDRVVVEEFLAGNEVSIHAMCDGNSAVLFPPARDYKRALDGDGGENTGGMGAVAPHPGYDPSLLTTVRADVIEPILTALAEQGRWFNGCLYPGLMDVNGDIRVLEFNARFGDPETQVYMRLLESDLLDVLDAAVEGELHRVKLRWRAGFAVCVVLTAKGYPGSYQTGAPITGIEQAESIPGVVVFHAGTAANNGLLTAGGRVLAVTAVADELPEALSRAYQAVECVSFAGMRYRQDIGAAFLSEL